MTATREDLIEALELMALQYLESKDGTLDHRFMSAGECCMRVLEEEGLVTGSGREYKWTEKSQWRQT